ncbi:biotin carboxylase [Streptomyces sp. KhCrAH-43]|uniref:ATP-grasp domain-containing protein n=1 Tax=unclassified Streptomyces TaxID=2593676 RepID=UPI00037E4200|nr:MULTISPECIES: ATP-grasp domain-containing protein [unclassified Streptomyces]MYS38379.1 ATP-grasp domain-containing protein [Streptomyces sp. SID4920]MYX66571.1 ATP-grasp domain-containing protein [Streptomyces sp. SID8373]RAJ68064.1 biotin carboxylase [Streptomyces sp. KhCrAH-43]
MATRIALLGGRPSVLRSAAELGCEVTMLAKPGMYDPEAARRWCVEVIDVDLGDQQAVLEAGRALQARQPVARFFSPAELGLVTAARLNEEFSLGGNPLSSVVLLKDKAAMRRHLEGTGLSPVRFAVVHSADELAAFLTGIGGPGIVKPLDYGGSRDVHKAEGPDLAAEVWERVETAGRDRMLVEEFLTGQEVSVEGFSADGRHTVVAVTDKLLGTGFVEAGHSVPARVDERTHEEIAELTARLLDAVGLVEGPSHTEIMITPDGLRIIESHNRAGGDNIPELVRLAYGVDLVRAAVAGPLGIEPWKDEVPVPLGGAAIRFLTAEPGVVSEVDLPADGLEGVTLDVKVKPGTVIPPVTWSADRVCGEVIAVGRDAEEAVARAESAAARIRIRTAPAA